MLKGKKIVLGITGSIAAYKSCLIIRGLIKKGAEVQVVITPAGKEFITPITLSALTHKPVVSEFFSQRDGTWNSHVDLGLWADAMVIAPCTASTMGKMAHGIADNMLITTYLSMKAPVFIAPAMDLDMYKHPSTQANMKTLLGYGNHIIEPEVGFLASGLEGKGRMEEPDVIVDYLDRYFKRSTCIVLIKAERYATHIDVISIKQRLRPADPFAIHHRPGFGTKIFNHPAILILRQAGMTGGNRLHRQRKIRLRRPTDQIAPFIEFAYLPVDSASKTGVRLERISSYSGAATSAGATKTGCSAEATSSGISTGWGNCCGCASI